MDETNYFFEALPVKSLPRKEKNAKMGKDRNSIVSFLQVQVVGNLQDNHYFER